MASTSAAVSIATSHAARSRSFWPSSRSCSPRSSSARSAAFSSPARSRRASQRAGGVTFFPYAVLDWGFVAPLSIAAAIGLWHATAWAHVLAAILLIKATTMGSALVSMNWFTARAGLDGDGLTPFYAALTAGGIWLVDPLLQPLPVEKEVCP